MARPKGISHEDKRWYPEAPRYCKLARYGRGCTCCKCRARVRYFIELGKARGNLVESKSN